MSGNESLPPINFGTLQVTDYAWFSLFTGFMCLTVGLAVYYLDKKSSINRLFTAILVLGSFWSITEFLRYQATSFLIAFILNKALVVWPFFFVLLLHFAFVYTDSDLLKHKITYVLMYVPAAVFAAVDLTTDLISAPPVQYMGGYQFSAPLISQSLVSTIDMVWASTLALTAVIVCLLYYFSSATQVKKQTKLITIGLVFPLIASFTETITNILNVPFPDINSITTFLFGVFIAFAIWRYKLFSLNPAVAAENIISAMPDPLILASPEGSIIRVNEEFVDASGYTQKEAIGKQLSDFFEKDSEKSYIEMFKTQEIKNYEATFITKSGEARCVLLSASEVHDRKGHGLGFACVIHDITAQKQMAAKLVAAERFASMGELAGMVGHDLRNPLSSMSAATYYLKNHYGTQMDSTGKEMLSAMEKSIDYSNKIIKDLLDYSREIRLELEETTPHEVLAASIALVKVPPNVKVIDKCENAPQIALDVGKVSRVYVNLITNAFDAMPDGGTLTITSQTVADTVEFTFEDTGSGISAEAMTKLWTPLFTTKTKGMGLGLPICKRIVDAHGGKITVESIAGKGTTFKIVLQIKPTKNSTV